MSGLDVAVRSQALKYYSPQFGGVQRTHQILKDMESLDLA